MQLKPKPKVKAEVQVEECAPAVWRVRREPKFVPYVPHALRNAASIPARQHKEPQLIC
ncbi:hypothetical protein FRC08_018574 [Ceratobasidium sp. 394]|nr:hypothetical protein FRC08_018574 [Ceratobasidium sp. 394]